MIQPVKPEDCTKLFVNLNDSRSYYLDLFKLYRRSKDCGNQTSLVSSTTVGDKDPNERVIDARNEAKETLKRTSRFFQCILLHTLAEENPVLPTRHHREGNGLTEKSWKT